MRRWAILVLLMPFGCAAKHDAAPPLAECGGQGCRPIFGSSQGQGTGGARGAAADAGDGVSLTVSAVAFVNSSASRAWSLTNVKAVPDAMQVKAPAVDGTIINENGRSPIVLSRVKPDEYSWVTVAPATTGSIYLPSMMGIAESKAPDVNVPLFLNDDFTFVSGLLTQTTLSLDSTKAQLALKIVDANGAGVRNARIVSPGGATTAYANSGTWIDTSLGPYTDDSGRVVVINLPAPQVPGALLTITAYGDNVSGAQVNAAARLPIAAGFVSYGTILLVLN